MIRHIKLHEVATYTAPVDINFKDINFIYGGNGTGKTTISKLISGEIQCSSCSVDSDGATNDTILVYNKTFVEKNFREVDEIAGIFTLGSESGEIINSIKAKEDELNNIRGQINSRHTSIEGFKRDVAALELKFNDDCWAVQVKYGSEFPKAMTGTRNAKSAFSKKCLELYKDMSGTPAKSIEELQTLYHAAFSKEATKYVLYKTIDLEKAIALDSNDLLARRITGKADSDIGRFIEYLKSSDWVKQGIAFAERAEGKCPYCSQPLPDHIRLDIESFFDKTYQSECNDLAHFASEYSDFHEGVIKYLADIIANSYDILSYESLLDKFSVYQSLVERNQALIQRKRATPSTQIEIKPCIDLLREINSIILEFNTKIAENNHLVDNQKDTQKNCEKEVWHFIVTELSNIIREYLKQRNGKQQAILNLNAQKDNLENTARNILAEIKEKRASISSIQYTVQAINHILDGYGFTGFMLAENESVPGTYRIVRPDGSDAKASLSEGEYNFITFLYFYHLILGSNSPEEVNKDKIIVIDDPISSLDSNVLFIVSSLVKNVVFLCRNREQAIKQVIISTHNIYFHKEITFVGNRDHWPETRTAFFIIRKKDQVSNVTEYAENQIQSSYEMLWNDIRNPEHGSAKSIFNTMRRILENYFNIIGGIDYEKCVNDFEGEDRIICKSLISCINEQSHTISDDYFMCVADTEVDHYQQIFKEIFEKMNHSSHYKMMMRVEE